MEIIFAFIIMALSLAPIAFLVILIGKAFGKLKKYQHGCC